MEPEVQQHSAQPEVPAQPGGELSYDRAWDVVENACRRAGEMPEEEFTLEEKTNLFVCMQIVKPLYRAGVSVVQARAKAMGGADAGKNGKTDDEQAPRGETMPKGSDIKDFIEKHAGEDESEAGKDSEAA